MTTHTMKYRQMKISAIVGAAAIILIAFRPGAVAQEKICRVTSYSMNTICKEWDGQWQGIAVASDGNCYFGTSTHSSGHGAGFHTGRAAGAPVDE